MATVIASHLTAEEFWEAHADRKHVELVRGEVIENMPPGGVHGLLALALGRRLGNWIDTSGGGCAGVESGFLIARDPDTVRGPDVSYVRAERIPAEGVPVAFWPFAPDLAVEIVSPDQSADEILEKVDEYLTAGVWQVWLIHPKQKKVVVHTPDGLARIYKVGDTLTGGDLLPGFSLPVVELFAGV